MKKKHTSVVRYIPLRDYHIAPLAGISPDALIEATERLLTEFKGAKDIERNTVLHFLIKKLGVTGGFGDFQAEYLKIREFMALHGLEKRYDLITPRYDLPIVNLRPRQVADRFFLSGKALPKRLFTGFDFDWGT